MTPDPITARDFLTAEGMPPESLNAFNTYLCLHPEYRRAPESRPRRKVYAPAVLARAFQAWRETCRKDAAQYTAPARKTAAAPTKPRRHPRRALEALHAATLRALLHHAALGTDPDFPENLAHDVANIRAILAKLEI